MQTLPIGHQSFRKIRELNMLYVDKTEHIHRLILTDGFYFLSRPRRFGKSLTLATIDEIFTGSRQLFDGLWIENHWDWSKTNPVVHISFNTIGYSEIGLEPALTFVLSEYAQKFGVNLQSDSPGRMLRELIEKVAAKIGKVVLLIDEYDKPLVDYLTKDKIETAKENRAILKSFYSGLKGKDTQEALRFMLITGVSKFSQVSVFSDLNYLNDITLGSEYAELVGYTQTELEQNFEEWMTRALQKFPGYSRQDLLNDIKMWYNGYSWDAETSVYNPFSILQFFQKRSFEDYWFKTGTPTFLMELVREQQVFDFNQLKVNAAFFDSYDLEFLDSRSLFFQTGYITIKNIDRRTGLYTLDYPNREVEQSMHNYLIGTLFNRPAANSTTPVLQLQQAFLANNPERVVQVVNSMLKDVPSHLIESKNEHFYHALVHLLFRYLGLFMDSEVHTSDGRMDATVQTDTHVYIIEFKLNKSADEAMRQIIEKQYADKYKTLPKTCVALAVNFDSQTKGVSEWQMETL